MKWVRGLALGGLAVLAGVGQSQSSDLANPGPYAAGFRRVTVVRPNSSTFTALLYYPAASAGENAPIAATGGPFPAISFGHGFLQPVSRYTSTLNHLATHGFLLIASESEGSLFPSHSNFALDLRHCLTYLEQQQASPGSFLFGRVRTDRMGLSGHSMGGGASLLAAAQDPRVDVVANLAAAETNPSATAAAANVPAPIFLIAGSNDGIVPVGSNGQLMYNAALPAKSLPVIGGGWHCGFQDSSSIGCDSGPLARADQLAQTRRLLTRVFNFYLKGEEAQWPWIWGPAMRADPQVATQANPGIAVSPESVTLGSTGSRFAGAIVTVTNTGRAATSFSLLPSSGLRGIVRLRPGRTPILAPGASVQIEVSPMQTGVRASGFIRVRNDLDGLTQREFSVAVR